MSVLLASLFYDRIQLQNLKEEYWKRGYAWGEEDSRRREVYIKWNWDQETSKVWNPLHKKSSKDAKVPYPWP
jgi:hypothetical protein